MDLDVQQLRSWIGRQDSRSELVTEAMVERFKATFDMADTVVDADVPQMLHWCLAPTATPTCLLGEDGHPARGGFLPPVPLPRRMWAGGSLAFHGNLRAGETLTRLSTIRDVSVKSGRSGTLCFVTLDHRIQADGRLAIEERQDIVYRRAEATVTEGRSPVPASRGSRMWPVPLTPAKLFRYSALTFNGHRIHYDAPYAREVEGYPGLVVHGPLQATMLVHMAAAIHGRTPARFEFRSHSPLFLEGGLILNADEEEGGLKLWTSALEGPVAMEAHASW